MKITANRILGPFFGLLLSPLVFISPSESFAEGGCPQSLYPIGGGYCRNVVCNNLYVGTGQMVRMPHGWVQQKAYSGAMEDKDAAALLAKYQKQCPEGSVANWGQLMVPIKKK